MLSSKFLHIYRTKQWEKWLQCTLNKCFLCEYFVKPWPYTESKFVENVKIFYLTFVWDSILDTLGKRLGIETHIYTTRKTHKNANQTYFNHFCVRKFKQNIPFTSVPFNKHTYVRPTCCVSFPNPIRYKSGNEKERDTP